MSIIFYSEKCTACGQCVEGCPFGVWALAEQRHGKLAPVAMELLGEARRLAEVLQVPVAAVLLGDKVEHLPPTLLAAGADKVYLVDDPCLADFVEEPYTDALTQLARRFQPE